MVNSTKGLTCKEFESDILLNNAICFRFIQISENAKKIPNSIYAKYSNIPWAQISGLRNRIVYDYGKVQLDVVYSTIIEDLPNLLDELEKIK